MTSLSRPPVCSGHRQGPLLGLRGPFHTTLLHLTAHNFSNQFNAHCFYMIVPAACVWTTYVPGAYRAQTPGAGVTVSSECPAWVLGIKLRSSSEPLTAEPPPAPWAWIVLNTHRSQNQFPPFRACGVLMLWFVCFCHTEAEETLELLRDGGF